jgi:hypothetical protein
MSPALLCRGTVPTSQPAATRRTYSPTPHHHASPGDSTKARTGLHSTQRGLASVLFSFTKSLTVHAMDARAIWRERGSSHSHCLVSLAASSRVARSLATVVATDRIRRGLGMQLPIRTRDSTVLCR